ncbi:MAG: HD domain-containing protein [Anaerolineaceae bacterium]|nr:HD domain-containing protein [Anaerolineaceae bacterium]
MKITVEEASTWYQEADEVHNFEHVLRVRAMAERIGKAEGADLEIIEAAAFLHDSRGASPARHGQERKEHHITSAEFAGQVLTRRGWSPERIEAVQHCIRAHRYRHDGERPETLEAQCLFDADKLDVLGAVGAARTIAYAVLAGQPVLSQPSQKFLQTGEKEAGEVHSSYHEYLFKLRNVKDQLYTQTGKAIAKERDAFLAEFYSRLLDEYGGLR